MYPDIHESVYVCMDASMSTNMYAHMHACMHVCVPNLYSHVMVHIFDMSLNKYGCNIANMTQTAIMSYILVCSR